jgi:hypothetical protein
LSQPVGWRQQPELNQFKQLDPDTSGSGYAADATVGALRASLGQIRVIVEHSS